MFGKDDQFTELVPNLVGVDPDDAFSSVPYEKGSSLLMYLEEKLGGPGGNIGLIGIDLFYIGLAKDGVIGLCLEMNSLVTKRDKRQGEKIELPPRKDRR